MNGMSKRINVNPNFYKTGGREHAEGHGEAIIHKRQKQQLNRKPAPARSAPSKKK